MAMPRDLYLLAECDKLPQLSMTCNQMLPFNSVVAKRLMTNLPAEKAGIAGWIFGW